MVILMIVAKDDEKKIPRRFTAVGIFLQARLSTGLSFPPALSCAFYVFTELSEQILKSMRLTKP